MKTFFEPGLEPEADLHLHSEADAAFDPELEPNDSAMFARSAMGGMPAAARAGVVNRTHRVVRHRATAMQARRSRVRSLMVPLAVCSVLLILTCLAVWTGLYQYQATEAAEAVQADVALLATADATDHFLVVLLWFVPVSLLAAVLSRRSRNGADSETIR